jgi:hypothetical protein
MPSTFISLGEVNVADPKNWQNSAAEHMVEITSSSSIKEIANMRLFHR